ncbi:MAG: tRNA uridine-5-carboxymethylaminomethyl(34) synthesis GTPase MnmE [Candidatus Hydrogenedentota bacterium]|nr:MAG: tRNA uridine-5-carboxymethylaminomethyl(34) synthesis GTPase MnmE [Candidatus Hydrogenedentota bacterium]
MKQKPLPPICAVATPLARSAIGAIRASGENSLDLIQKIFQGKGKSSSLRDKPRYAHYGNIVSQDKEILDDVILIPYVAPHSYTGEDSFEIFSHGNPLVLDRILQELFRLGFEQARPGEFTKRAFLNGKLNLSEAQAIEQIVSARSARELKLARENKEGKFRTLILQLRSSLLNVLADCTAELDFIEEDIQFLSEEEKLSNLKQLKEKAEKAILASNEVERWRSGIQTAILGAPNAGKSSLLNYLLGHERALVSPIAGTTRDYLEASVEIEGIPFVFLDTAGIRNHASDTIEQRGIEKSLEIAQKADFILWILDGSLSPSEACKPFMALDSAIFHKKTLWIVNKIDILHDDWKRNGILLPEVIGKKENLLFVSIAHERNMDTLRLKIHEYAKQTETESAYLLEAWQKIALQNFLREIENAIRFTQAKVSTEMVVAALHAAMDFLAELTGEISNEEVLGRIFSRFCIGK